MNTTKTKMPRRLAAAVAVAGSLGLAACGGGGDGNSTTQFVPGSQVPVSATTSVAGVIAFMQGLIATTSENGDPIPVGDAVLATSESDDGSPL